MDGVAPRHLGRPDPVPGAAVRRPVSGSSGRSLRDLRAGGPRADDALGRLVVVASPAGEPAVGRSFALDAITTLGRDVNNAIVIDDPFASAEHAVLTYRGRGWYVEDLGSTNGTYVNGRLDRTGRRRSPSATRSGSARSGCRLERPRERHERRDAGAAGAARGRAPAPRVLGPIRPRPRWTEARLLARRRASPCSSAACRWA